MRAWARLAVCGVSTVAALSLYGWVESCYMSCPGYPLRCNALSALFVAAAAAPLVILRGIVSKASLALFSVFVALYVVSLAYIRSHSSVYVPNLLPQVVTYYGDAVPITYYHITLFLFGFLSLTAAYATLTGPGPIIPRFLALLGTLTIGLVYQDWYWFITAPRTGLACGSRYGIYFTSWLRLGQACVPTMYIIGVTAGLATTAVSSTRFMKREEALKALLTIAAASATLYVIGACLT